MSRDDAIAPPAGPPWTRAERCLLGVVLVTACVLRVRAAARTPLWFDELFTLWMARHPLAEMLPLLGGDVHPPLPTLLVAAWRALGGDGTTWLKLLPVTIGLLAVAATHGFARSLFGPRTGLLAAAILALHPMHIYFSQELRSYGLLTLALLLAAWAAWRWVASGRTRDAVAWALAAALTVHTHYLGIVVLGCLDAWVVFRLWRTPRRLLAWVVAHGGVLALALPLAGMLPGQLELSRTSWVPRPRFSDVLTLVRKTSLGALYLIPPLWGLAVLALSRPATRSAATLAAWMAAGPVIVTIAISLAGGHLFSDRYLFLVVPYACALFAAGATALRPRAAALAASLVVLGFAARAAWLWHPLPEPVALREVSRVLERGMRPDDLLFCADTHSLICLDHHLRGDRARIVLTGEPLPYYVGNALVSAARRVPPDSVRAAAAGDRRWWAVRTREGGRSTIATADLLDSVARGPRVQVAMVTVWAGRAGMFDSAAIRALRATDDRLRR